MCVFAILSLFQCVMNLCCSHKMIVITGNVKRLWTTTRQTGSYGQTRTTTYWALVTYRMVVVSNHHSEKGTDSLPGETEPSSIFLEDSEIEEDTTAADGVPAPPGTLFWKRMEIPAAIYAEYEYACHPLPLMVLPNRPRSAVTADKLGSCKPAFQFAVYSAVTIAVGYVGVALPLDILCVMTTYSCSKQPWYIVAAYFLLPLCCMVCCFVDSCTTSDYGVVSSEEDGTTAGGEAISDEKISMSTRAEIV